MNSNGGLGRETGAIGSPVSKWARHAAMLTVIGLAVIAAGCRSTPPSVLSEDDKKPYVAEGVQPGDVLQITFPGAPNMNSTQPVQPNGTIALPLGGGLAVRDKSTAAIEKEVLALYGPQLVIKEVTVGLQTAGFPVLVSGAVLRPGKVQSTRSMTVLEAIVEAGGFIQGRADTKRVRVVRLEKDGTTRTLTVDLKKALSGDSSEAVYVRPSDVINVPERFSFY